MYVKQPYFTGHGDAPPPEKPPKKQPASAPVPPVDKPAEDAQK